MVVARELNGVDGMNIEYNVAEDRDECVAVIQVFPNGAQSIAVKTDEGCTIFYDSGETPNHGGHIDWRAEVGSATKKLYPGDKITITF